MTTGTDFHVGIVGLAHRGMGAAYVFAAPPGFHMGADLNPRAPKSR